jgi:hypothetical protein
MYFFNSSTGFSGGAGSIYKTTNGGTNWTAIVNPGLGWVYGITFLNANTGFIAEGNGAVMKSTDSGNSWFVQQTGCLQTLYGISFVDVNTGYVVGTGGAILKTIDGGGTIGVKQISTVVPNSFSLLQNYPNPFNPSTKIRYELPNNGFVKLVVFDELGREIETLVNEKQNAGTYESIFNASQYPSGVYFYKLTTDNFTETKKMLMIK